MSMINHLSLLNVLKKNPIERVMYDDSEYGKKILEEKHDAIRLKSIQDIGGDWYARLGWDNDSGPVAFIKDYDMAGVNREKAILDNKEHIEKMNKIWAFNNESKQNGLPEKCEICNKYLYEKDNSLHLCEFRVK